MTDYNALKVTELHAELHNRGIAFEKKHKKADLVRLLQDNDGAEGFPATVSADESAPIALADPITSETATNSASVASQAKDVTSESIATQPDASAQSSKGAPTDSAIGVAAPAVDAEVEKRKARAAKFGVPYVEPTPATKISKKTPSSSTNGKQTPGAGTTSQKPSPSPVNAAALAESEEVLAKRRAKFGVVAPVEKNKKNGEIVSTAAETSLSSDPAIAERARIDEEKRKAREERFKSETATDSTGGSKRQADETLNGQEPAEKKAKA